MGEADRRFEEDGLRILRALRFAAVLDFTIEKETARAMERKRSLLQYIAPERIFSEWKKLLCGKNAADVLRKYVGVAAEILPELTPMCGFEQHSVFHCYDVWEHSLQCYWSTRLPSFLSEWRLFSMMQESHIHFLELPMGPAIFMAMKKRVRK